MSNTPICDRDTPDPWVIKHGSVYYLTFTCGSHIEIWSSPTLQDFHSNNDFVRRSTIWRPTPGSPWSADIWAPELHFLQGTWYIYTCGAPPHIGNSGHRTIVLRSRNATDPLNTEAWEFLGPLKGLPEDQWSIDATVFTTAGGQELFCCYSGWPLGDHSDTQQDLFLVRLRSPTEAVPESLTCIARATLDWERPEGGRRGVNEGPSFLSLPPSTDLPSGFKGVVFSAHGSWGPEYKLGLLALVDPTQPCCEQSWVKKSTPLLVSDEREGPPFGPGHASFVLGELNPNGVPDSIGVYCVYHGTERVDDGWKNRKARVLRLEPGAFAASARPVCCAKRHSMPGGGYAAAAAPGTGMLADQMPVGRTAGMGHEVWKQVEKLVPGQYQGYLDKVKRFF